MTRNAVFSSGAALATALIATAAFSSPAYAQGQTRTLDDLRTEYRAQCGKNGSRERLLVAYDRAIRIAPGPASRKHLTAQRAAVANPREPVCPEPPKPLTPVPAKPLPVPVAQGEAEDVCDRPAPNPRIAECKRFRLILGRWSSPKGGVIETVLTPDGTISATIISASKWMTDYGYRAGMQVFRNWKPRLGTANWVVFAQDGEAYYTEQPNNKYGEPYTTGRWRKGGVIAISGGSTNVIGIPNTERLSNYTNWTRVGEPR
jgi:hypothetical protein